MAVINYGQIRKSVHEIKAIEALLDKDNYPVTKSKAHKIEISGMYIDYYTLHYHIFFVKGNSCCFCGLSGTFFALEYEKKHDTYRLNLYGIDQNEDEVMITYFRLDESLKSSLGNVQPICRKCLLVQQREVQFCKEPVPDKVEDIREVTQEYPILFDGTLVKSSKVVAFCHNLGHFGWISERLAEKHKCIKKKCSYFEKANPAYWSRKVKPDSNKKELRAQAKLKNKSIAARNLFIRSFFEPNKEIYITAIFEEARGLTIYYIFNKQVDLSEELSILRKKLDCKVFMRAVITTPETIVRLIRKKKQTDFLHIPGVDK